MWNRLKAALTASVFFLAVGSLRAELFNLTNFSCGLKTTQDASLISDGCATDLKNVDVKTGALETRLGSVQQNSSAIESSDAAIRFLHQYVDASGNFWLISVTSNTISASSNAGVTNTVLVTTYGVTTASDFSAINAFGKARLTDGATNWILWDGTTVSVSTASPKSKVALFAYERIWAAVGSNLSASAFGDPEDWTDDGIADDDAFTEPIRSDDGYAIRAAVEWRGDVYVFKDYSIDRLSTSDGLTFSRTAISNTVGTRHPKSIQTAPEGIYFLGPDHFYLFNGVSLTPISDGIQNTVDAVNQLDTAEQSQTLTSQSDFTGGQSTYTSINITAGRVLRATYSVTETDFGGSGYAADGGISVGANLTSAYAVVGSSSYPSSILRDLTGGTTVTLDSNTPSNTQFVFSSTVALTSTWVYDGMTLNRIASKFYYVSNSLSTGSWTFGFGCNRTSASGCYGVFTRIYLISLTTSTPADPFSAGGYALRWRPLSSASAALDIVKDGNTVLSSTTFNTLSTTVGGTVFSFKRTASGELSAYVDGVLTLSATDASYSNFPFIAFGHSQNAAVNDSADTEMGWTHFSSMPSQASYLSPPLDFSTPNQKYLQISGNYSLSAGSVSFVVYVDTDTSISTTTASTYISSSAVSENSPFLTTSSRYVRYLATLNGLTAGVSATSLASIGVTGAASTGTYLTPAVSVASMTYWGSVGIVDSASTGTLTYTVYSDTDTNIDLSNSGSYTASQSVVNGQIPAIATGAYVRLGASFTGPGDPITAPYLDAVTFNYGLGISVPVASLYFDQSYYASVSISSSASNDSIMVYDENQSWTLYDNLDAYSMSLYRQKPYVGRADGADIWRILVPDLYTDNGEAYTSSWTSKEFNFGFPVTNKTMNRYYISGEYRAGQDVDFIYGVNRSTTVTTVDVDMDTQQGSFRKVINPPSTTTKVGRTHKFKFLNDDLNESFNIHAVSMDVAKESNP